MEYLINLQRRSEYVPDQLAENIRIACLAFMMGVTFQTAKKYITKPLEPGSGYHFMGRLYLEMWEASSEAFSRDKGPLTPLTLVKAITDDDGDGT